jgi:hypothetical protein
MPAGLQGAGNAVPAKLEADLFTMVKSNWALWVPFQFVNFSLVPVNLQVHAVHVQVVVGGVGGWQCRYGGVGRMCCIYANINPLLACLQTLAANMCALIWNVYMSFITHSGRKESH